MHLQVCLSLILFMLFFSVAELNVQVPVESRKTQLPPVNNQIIPDELLVSLASTVCNRSTLGLTAHHRHCKVHPSPVNIREEVISVWLKSVHTSVPNKTLYTGLWNQTAGCSLASPARTQEIQILSGAANFPHWSWQVSLTNKTYSTALFMLLWSYEVSPKI